MCLAVPGKIMTVTGEGPLNRTGKVEFGGVLRDVNLAYVPEADTGDWVLIHAGFAISTVDEEEAALTLEEMKRLADVGGGLIGDESDREDGPVS
ncbi:HypC/HybG/HupF family hydrogenase formation chaperone [bacterium]|nr:HypC/HybG/HupF family hydrogenase formation chaperone [bacterium]